KRSISHRGALRKDRAAGQSDHLPKKVTAAVTRKDPLRPFADGGQPRSASHPHRHSNPNLNLSPTPTPISLAAPTSSPRSSAGNAEALSVLGYDLRSTSKEGMHAPLGIRLGAPRFRGRGRVRLREHGRKRSTGRGRWRRR